MTVYYPDKCRITTGLRPGAVIRQDAHAAFNGVRVDGGEGRVRVGDDSGDLVGRPTTGAVGSLFSWLIAECPGCRCEYLGCQSWTS